MDVKFISKMSKYENCSCTACHDVGRVMKVSLPTTLFHDGRNLSTKYKEYWLCCSCRSKLSNALDYPEDE
jgi:hypothetical protein